MFKLNIVDSSLSVFFIFYFFSPKSDIRVRLQIFREHFHEIWNILQNLLDLNKDKIPDPTK